MPSSFSLIHQPVGSWSVSHLCARRTGGAVPPSSTETGLLLLRDFGLGVGAEAPMRAVSAASPRYARRCLQVRNPICAPWLRHAGHVHEYTLPWRCSSYVPLEPLTETFCPSASVPIDDRVYQLSL